MQNFERLSHYDFELLVADLLSAEWDVRVESFPAGPDGGVDLRVLGPAGPPLNLATGDELVVQCKHLPNGVLADLRPALRAEAARPIVDQAARYVLATSARLTRKNKKEIVSLFGHRVAEGDVLAREDLADLLGGHPDVARANIKLWLTDLVVAQALLNQVEHLRSESFKEEILRLQSTFVETSVLRHTRQILDQFGVCILAGPPGVGKTVTASILLLLYMAEGWQPVVAISEVRELEEQLHPGCKQVLFFDDFLGQNSLDAKLSRGEDSALVRLMHAVERDQDKILILTTREYVLQQARQSYEKLGDELLELVKVTVDVEDITASQRAHILYNQLYFSPLRQRAAAAADRARRYTVLTQHPNYNPRLVEAAIAAAVRDLGLPRERRTASAGSPAGNEVPSTAPDVPDMLHRALDNPAALWDHVLRHQLTRLQRDLLIARTSMGAAPVYLTSLTEAASAFGATEGRKPRQADLHEALQVLEGDLLAISSTTRGHRPGTVVGALKPGVTNAVLDYLRHYPDDLHRLAASATFYEQVHWITSLLVIADSNRHQPLRKPADQHLVHELAQAAERTLISTLPAVQQWSVLAPASAFDDFGRRLDTFAAICTAAGLHASPRLGDQVIPALLNAMPNVQRRELPQIVTALRSEPLSAWTLRRTEIDLAVLRRLEDADDLDSWSLLRDALDIIDTTPEYLEDMSSRFQEFAEDLVQQAEQALDDTKDDPDADLPDEVEELDELEDLAWRWETPVHGISEITDQVRDLEDQRSSQPPGPRRSSAASTRMPEQPARGSIFDRLLPTAAFACSPSR